MYDFAPFEYRRGMLPYWGGDDPEHSLPRNNAPAAVKTDIRDTGEAYELEAELPGFQKEDINVFLDGNYLTVNAQHSNEKEIKDDKGRYIRRERCYGIFSRSFDVSHIQPEGIIASYEDGVLKLHLPKKEEETPDTRQIEIQ